MITGFGLLALGQVLSRERHGRVSRRNGISPQRRFDVRLLQFSLRALCEVSAQIVLNKSRETENRLPSVFAGILA
jgi:hypothetical protein